MTDEENDKKTEENVEQSEPESPTQSEPTETSAGAEQEKSTDNYGMVMELLKQVQDNQTRLIGEIAAIKDAQSVLVDAGAVIHDDSAIDEPAAGVDEYIPIEKLDLLVD